MANPDRFAQLIGRLFDGIGRLTRPTKKIRLRSGYTKKGPNLVVGRGRRAEAPMPGWLRATIVIGTVLIAGLLILAAA